METAIEPTKAPRVRRVFAKRLESVEGIETRFELTAQGLRVKRNRARSATVLGWQELADLAKGQRRLL